MVKKLTRTIVMFRDGLPEVKPIRGISMKKRARVTSDNVMRIIKGSDANLESKTGKSINAREARGKFSDLWLF